MDSDSHHICVVFHKEAGVIVSQTVAAFENAVKDVSRKQAEYRFVQLKEQYMHTLKQQLEDAANRIVRQHQHHRQLNKLQHDLQQIIKDYLHGFVMQSRNI